MSIGNQDKNVLCFDQSAFSNFVLYVISDNFPSLQWTGCQFWRGSQKILVAKKSEKSYLRRGRVLKKKKSTTRDILDRLRKMVSSDVEEEDNFRESPSPEPRQSNQLPGKSSSSSSQDNVEEAAAKMIKSMFRCSVCLSQCKLTAATCSTCYAVIGCVHCLEQWIESTILHKCWLCSYSTGAENCQYCGSVCP